MRALERRPQVLVSASAIGFNGDRGDAALDESSPSGSDFLAQVCADWEREALAAEALGVRVVCVRVGIVLSATGGALSRMVTPFRLGLGGRLGGGQQWMSWIHIDDLVGLLLHAGRTPNVRGPLNAVAPHPVTNENFTKTLGQVLHRPAVFPVPTTALRLAFGEMSAVLLASQRVSPRVAQDSGYSFLFPQLEGALKVLLSPAAQASPPQAES